MGPLNDRRKSLEEEFFHHEQQKQLAALRAKLSVQERLEELKKVSGMTDETVLSHFVDLGLTGDTIAAIAVVPLLRVAWADGKIQDAERTAILAGAAAKGITAGTAAYDELSSWLTQQPSEKLYAAWQAFIVSLAPNLTAEERSALKTQVMDFARAVATAAGGVLGFGSISRGESKVLDELLAVLDG